MLIAVVCLAIGSGCSGSDSAGPSDPTVVSTVVSSAATVPGAERSAGTIDLTSTEPLRVDMVVMVDSTGTEVDLSATIDPDALEETDPFGTFASCSGSRRSIGSYSVLVSVPDGVVSAGSLLTVDPVTGPGIYDVDVRVEQRSGLIQLATGTVTIGADLRSGTFVGFEPEGGKISGSFECSGGDASPTPLPTGDEVGVLDSVEVVALLRRDDAERVVGLAVDTARLPGASAECPAAVGAPGQVVVRVDGDQSVGAITTFELTDGGSPTMRLRVGGASYEFDDVVITVADPATAGTFSATADGLSVDGAFRCT